MEWFTPNKEHVFWQEIINNINYVVNQDIQHMITVGADSQTYENLTVYIVVICIVSDCEPFKRNYYFSKIKEEKEYSLYNRIYKEAKLSIDIATAIKDLTSSACNIDVHLDVSSPEAKAKTSKYAKGLMHLVNAFDFDVSIKPNSWAASSIADKHSKKGKKK